MERDCAAASTQARVDICPAAPWCGQVRRLCELVCSCRASSGVAADAMFASSLPCTVRTVVVPCTWCGLIQGWPTGSLATAMVSQPATGAAGLPRSASSATSSGRSAVGKTPASAPHKQDKQGSWWASLRAALLPVPESTHAQRSGGMASAQNAAAGSQLSAGPSAIAVRPAINERLQRVREATERQRAQAQDPDVFIPLSNDAEMFSGWLFKVSIGMITLPLAGEPVHAITAEA